MRWDAITLREERKGCRVIFEWRVSTRWPDQPINTDFPDLYIEGIEFSDIRATARFDVVGSMTGGEIFSNWEEAREWLNQCAAP
jgi:hypothetical protein